MGLDATVCEQRHRCGGGDRAFGIHGSQTGVRAPGPSLDAAPGSTATRRGPL